MTNKLSGIVAVVGSVINSVVDLLPVPLATRVHAARKAIIGAAGSAVTLLAAIGEFSLPAGITPWVAGALVVATGITAWAVPNAQ